MVNYASGARVKEESAADKPVQARRGYPAVAEHMRDISDEQGRGLRRDPT